MEQGAYLVGHLDTTKFPPVLLRVGVYSTPARLLTMVKNEFAFDIASHEKAPFDVARKALIKHVREVFYLQWVRPYMTGVN